MSSWREHITLSKIAIAAVAVTFLALLIGLFGVLGQAEKPRQLPEVTITAAPEPPVTPIPAEPTPSPTPSEFELYADCSEVWEALGRPITEDDEGYPESKPNKFDLDSDGVGCEDNPATKEDESDVDWKGIWEKTKGNAEDFADWATPKLRDFWNEFAAPGVSSGLEEASRLWNSLKG